MPKSIKRKCQTTFILIITVLQAACASMSPMDKTIRDTLLQQNRVIKAVESQREQSLVVSKIDKDETLSSLELDLKNALKIIKRTNLEIIQSLGGNHHEDK